MSRPALEIADVFRDHGPAWRKAHAGHVSLEQLKVMSAIESCRTAALGGHVLRCENCARIEFAYNSCRNRHCPKCQGATAKEWLAQREAELLPVPYFHVVFTLPARIADLAYQNKAVIYDLLLKVSAETLSTIAADPKRLGVHIGILSVLHTWGSALTRHPHVHMIVAGGGPMIIIERFERGANYALPAKPTDASDQDRYVMTSLDVGSSSRCRVPGRALARVNTTRRLQTNPSSSRIDPQTHPRKPIKRVHLTQTPPQPSCPLLSTRPAQCSNPPS